MNIKIEVKNESNEIVELTVSRSYLSKFVSPNKEYIVDYTINNDGTRNNMPCMLLGKDLTENQIAILFSERQL